MTLDYDGTLKCGAQAMWSHLLVGIVASMGIASGIPDGNALVARLRITTQYNSNELKTMLQHFA